MTDRLLTIKEGAAKLCASPRTVADPRTALHRLLLEKEAFVRIGDSVRLIESRVQAVIEDCTQRAPKATKRRRAAPAPAPAA